MKKEKDKRLFVLLHNSLEISYFQWYVIKLYLKQWTHIEAGIEWYFVQNVSRHWQSPNDLNPSKL